MRCKLALFTDSMLAVPLLQNLFNQNRLACIVVTENQYSPETAQLIQLAKQMNIPLFSYDSAHESPLFLGLDESQANVGVAFFFNRKLSDAVVNYFSEQMFNLHPGTLPQYRGANPIYWQLRNGEASLNFALHKVTSVLDAGDIALQLPIPIHPFETAMSVSHKVAQQAPMLIEQFIQSLQQGSVIWTPPSSAPSWQARRVSEQDLMIDWHRDASLQVVNMARAGNPIHGGALFRCKQDTYSLLQARALSKDEHINGVRPGTITQVSESKGLIVQSKDAAVALEATNTPIGVLSGYRFSVLFGITSGMQLESMPRDIQQQVKPNQPVR